MDDVVRSARIVQLLKDRGILLMGEIRVLGREWDFVLEDPDAAAARLRRSEAKKRAFRGVDDVQENPPLPDLARVVDALRGLDGLEGRSSLQDAVTAIVGRVARGEIVRIDDAPPGLRPASREGAGES